MLEYDFEASLLLRLVSMEFRVLVFKFFDYNGAGYGAKWLYFNLFIIKDINSIIVLNDFL